jgi:hypothetical protein
LRQANIKLKSSDVSNATKTSRKNEAVVQLLSTLILPSAPPADGDMSKLIPDYFIEKEDAHELDYFGRLINGQSCAEDQSSTQPQRF